MFYFRKFELILRFNELTANDAQCLLSKDKYSIAHSFEQLVLSIYLGVDEVKRYAQKHFLFQTDNENCGFYFVLTNVFLWDKNYSILLSSGQDLLLKRIMHLLEFHCPKNQFSLQYKVLRHIQFPQ